MRCKTTFFLKRVQRYGGVWHWTVYQKINYNDFGYKAKKEHEVDYKTGPDGQGLYERSSFGPNRDQWRLCRGPAKFSMRGCNTVADAKRRLRIFLT